jgi:hypothetical protein
MLIVIVILLAFIAASTVTLAFIACLFYVRLRGVNLPRLRFEIEQLWKKREQPKLKRPLGV